MKSKLIIPVAFLVVFVLSFVFGGEFVTSWKSFLVGIIFALAVRDVGKELIRHVSRR
ncbi:MAG: hypothetical protein IJ774_05565 [Selenomonadaceae bacterium]|nr:hypothetical protein [Selenomonadaceae bacterium]